MTDRGRGPGRAELRGRGRAGCRLAARSPPQRTM